MMTNQLAKDLRAAKALIDTPEKWCKLSVAEDANGNPVDPESSQACCFCSHGAVRRVTRSTYDRLAAFKALEQATPRPWWHRTSNVTSFNDHPYATHADVMALFDRAIAAVEDA